MNDLEWDEFFSLPVNVYDDKAKQESSRTIIFSAPRTGPINPLKVRFADLNVGKDHKNASKLNMPVKPFADGILKYGNRPLCVAQRAKKKWQKWLEERLSGKKS